MSEYGVQISDEFKRIWGLMLKSKKSAEPAPTIIAGLLRVNQLTSDYIHEMYGAAAIEVDGRYFTPYCRVLKSQPKTAAERRKAIKQERQGGDE